MRRPLIGVLIVLAGCPQHGEDERPHPEAETAEQSDTRRVALLSWDRGPEALSKDQLAEITSTAERLGLQLSSSVAAKHSELPALVETASRRARLIIATGRAFRGPMMSAAAKNPDRHYVGVRIGLREGAEMPRNLTALEIKDEQIGYLAGAIASKLTRSQRIGFVGAFRDGSSDPLEVGFRAGYRQSAPNAEMVITFAAADPGTPATALAAKARAEDQIRSKVDVLVHLPGPPGAGVVAAAAALGALAVCAGCAPRADDLASVAGVIALPEGLIQRALERHVEGTLSTGLERLGLEAGVVRIAFSQQNASASADLVRSAEALREAIIRGEVEVPARRGP